MNANLVAVEIRHVIPQGRGGHHEDDRQVVYSGELHYPGDGDCNSLRPIGTEDQLLGSNGSWLDVAEEHDPQWRPPLRDWLQTWRRGDLKVFPLQSLETTSGLL